MAAKKPWYATLGQDELSRQSAIITEPEFCVIDCGSFQGNDRYFGALCGSEVVVASLVGAGPPLGPTIRSNRLRELLRGLRATVRDEHYHLLRPWSGDDPSMADELLSPESELYVFVPDMHVGVRDGADDFLDRPDTFEALWGVLEAARQLDAVIIQLGDMFDIWEAEALPEIFYIDPSAPRPRTTPVPRRAPGERAKLALGRIHGAWREAKHERLDDLLRLFDHYLPGNHDAEVRFGAADGIPVVRELLGRETRRGDELPHRRERYIKPSRWIAEHGHLYDDDNSTESVSRVEDLEQVKGKRITLAYVQGERITSTGADGPQVITPTAGQGEGLLKEGSKLAGAAESVLPSWATINQVRRGLETVHFDRMRNRIVRSLGVHLKRQNPNRTIGVGTTQIFCSGEEPFQMPFRAMIHAHTHSPGIARIPVRLGPKTTGRNLNLDWIVDPAAKAKT